MEEREKNLINKLKKKKKMGGQMKIINELHR